MPVPLTFTFLAVAVICLFVNDALTAIACCGALLNQGLVELARARGEVVTQGDDDGLG